jgi:hypothetical protein
MKPKPFGPLVWAAALVAALAAGVGLMRKGAGRSAEAAESREDEVEAHPS